MIYQKTYRDSKYIKKELQAKQKQNIIFFKYVTHKSQNHKKV